MEIYAKSMDVIHSYAGLSPAAFFTIAALMVVTYRIVCGMFVDPEEFNKSSTSSDSTSNHVQTPKIYEPVQLGDVSERELKAYDGSDPNKPLLMAIKGQIYDVSSSRYYFPPFRLLFLL